MRILGVGVHLVTGYPGRVCDDQRELLVRLEHVLHRPATHRDSVRHPRCLSVVSCVLTRVLVCVDHDEVTVVVAYGEEADVAGASAQLEHRPGGDEREQARGPTRLGCRPWTRLENALVVGDLEAVNGHGAHDRLAGCAPLRSRLVPRTSHL